MGGKKATTTSKVTIPPEVLARYNAVNARAETAAAAPFAAFGNTAADYVAQLNARQNAGFNDINATAGSYLPYMTEATTATRAGLGPAYEGIDNYMSPYIKNVADTTGAYLRQQQEQAQSGALGNAISSGAFGGDRAGIAAANLQQQNQMAYGKTMADILNQGYTQALGASQADLARQLAGGEQLAGLGAQSQQLGLQGAQAKIAAGTMEQQTEQAGKDAMINRFMQEKGYPFQTAQFLANIAMGTGAASGSTTSTQQPVGFFQNLFADGGKVNGYADGGGVSGPMTSAMSPLGIEGYVPAAGLPVGKLMIADPPEPRKRADATDMIKIAQIIGGMASGGVAGGRHGYATDGGVFLPDIKGEDETRGEMLARLFRPYQQFATKTLPTSALALGTKALSLVPEALSYGLAAAQRPQASDLMRSTAQSIQDFGNKTRDEGLQYRGANQAEPLTGQAALALARTTPEQDAAREAFMRQNMDPEPSRVGPDGYTPSDYGAAMLRGPTAAGWTLGSQPRVSVMTPYGVAGRPEVDVGSMPAAPQRVYGRPDVGVGSMPKYDAPQEAYGRPDVSLGSMPAAPLGMFDMPVGSMPSQLAAMRPPRRPEGLGYMPTMPEGGPTTLLDGLMPASLAPLTSPIPPRRPVDLGTPIIPTEEGAGIAKAALTTLGQPPVVAGVDVDTLFTQGIGKNEGGLGPNGEPLIGAAGEVGYSQMLPSTGPEAAKLAGLPWDPERFRTDTEYNKALGKAYYANLLKMFGDPVKAAAAYNAGMGRVGSAIDAARNYGGTWMDHIPASTQDYVKKFAANVGMTAPPTLDGLGAARVAPAVDTTGGLLDADMTRRRDGNLLNNNKPYDERNMLGQFFYNKDDGKLNKNAIMSVLAGLGSMANSNSMSPLTAILQGVAGGSEAYKQLEKQAADIAQTEALTRQTDVATDVNRFFSAVGPDGFPMVIVGNGRPAITLTEYLKNPTAFSTGDPARDAALQQEARRRVTLGPVAPEGVRWTSASTDAIAAARENINPGDFVNNNKANFEKVYMAAADRSDALAAKPNINELAYTVGSAIADENMGTVEGYLSDNILPKVNAVLRSVFGEDATISDADDQATILAKLSKLNAVEMKPDDQRAASVFRDFMSVSPDLTMTPESAAAITASMIMQNQVAIDRANYYSAFKTAIGPGASMQDADAAFAQEYGQMHQMEKDALTKLFTMADDNPQTGKIVKDFLTEMNAGSGTEAEALEVLQYLLGPENVPPQMARILMRGM